MQPAPIPQSSRTTVWTSSATSHITSVHNVEGLCPVASIRGQHRTLPDVRKQSIMPRRSRPTLLLVLPVGQSPLTLSLPPSTSRITSVHKRRGSMSCGITSRPTSNLVRCSKAVDHTLKISANAPPRTASRTEPANTSIASFN